MKKDAHPKYYTNAKFSCECGNVVVTGSTLESYKVEICSACHPFYTGKQKLVDTAGRVEKFMAKRKKAENPKEETEISESAKKSKKDEKYLTVDEFKAIKEKEKDKAVKREVKKTGGESKAKTVAKKPVAKKPAAKKPAAKKPAAKKTEKK